MEPVVLIPNLNRRFSGITSTVASVVPHQAREMEVAVVGYPLPVALPHLSWKALVVVARKPLPGGHPRIFHARRNNEMLLGLLLKKVFRCHLHLVFTSTAQRKHSAWTRGLYLRMDSLISTSPKAAGFLVRQPDVIIPHGVDLKTYSPSPERAVEWAEGGLPGKRGIGIFGRVRPQKGIREFVEAMSRVLPRVPDLTAVIVGEVTPKYHGFVRELKEAIRRRDLEDRFCWLGKVPFTDIPTWFRRMSLVVCASHNEGFGLTCLEAMASGVPVVATQAGAWDSIIRNGLDGALVPCRDAGALAGGIEALLAHPLGLDGLGRAARQRVEEAFSIEREAASLNAHYRRSLG